jgi:hypothetical protein
MSYKKTDLSNLKPSEHYYPCMGSSFNAVIIGSFRKHLHQILKLRSELEKLHVTIMSPPHDKVLNPNDEFVIFQSDPTDDPKILQDCVFSKIRNCTFIIVANFDNYIGRAGTMEIGFALAHGIGIYTIEPVNDPHLSPYCRLLTDVFPNLDLSKIYNPANEFAELATSNSTAIF